MKTTPNLPPLPRVSRRHVARELAGLFLIGTGTVGLSVVTAVVNPMLCLFLGGISMTAGALGLLYKGSLTSNPAHSLLTGYCLLGIGLALIAFTAWAFSPWTLACLLVLGGGAWLSSKGA
ncbi:hypothetical protein ACIQ9R_35865 [Streptomyces sp. NPDC094447]|uniref:hypothetical protein n=1 Tax=Streptomyces sp. NPDC094447 TaxID=3366062 RepID=UPI00382ED5D0